METRAYSAQCCNSAVANFSQSCPSLPSGVGLRQRTKVGLGLG